MEKTNACKLADRIDEEEIGKPGIHEGVSCRRRRPTAAAVTHTPGRNMLKPGLLMMSAMAILASAVWPCSVVGPLPSAQDLVKQAEVIVRVRAEGLAETPGRPGSSTQVRFAVVRVLKGRLSSTTIEFNGVLSDRDDRNDRPVPYDFIRPGGRGGNCFALTYRPGAEYLLLLRRPEHSSYAQPNDLTPYWTPLSPTNEQLFGGGNDPWLAWVTQRIRER